MFKDKIALIIGINEYDIPGAKLKTPKQDAEDIAKILEDKFGYRIINIHNTIYARNGEIKYSQLKDFFLSFDTYLEAPKEQTQVLIYYAGHGVAQIGNSGLSGYFVASDSTDDVEKMISMNILYEAVVKLKCQQTLIVLDCCFAGAFRTAESTMRGLDMGLGSKQRPCRQHLDFYTKHRSCQVITSTNHRQLALDSIQNRANSPFAELLKDELEKNTFLENYHFINISRLQDEVKRRLGNKVGAVHHEQLLQFFELRHKIDHEEFLHDGGDFVFQRKDFGKQELDNCISKFENPYRGLKSYEINHSKFFFGRNQAIEDLWKLIERNQKIVVVGASGTGKSSLVQAGILPKLLESGYQKNDIVVKVPGRQPLDMLKEVEVQQCKILVVDQLEELITQAAKNDQPDFDRQIQAFFENLDALGKEKLIFTLRTDFERSINPADIYWRTSLEETAESNQRFMVKRLKTSEIRETVIRPAFQVGRFFHPETLVDIMIREVENNPNTLPLLSFTLSEMVELHKDDKELTADLTHADYQKVGGILGSLQKKAYEVFTIYKDNQPYMNMLKNLLLRMISQQGIDITKRKVYTEALEFGDDRDSYKAEILQELCDKRRLVTAESNYFEPCHDAFVSSWAPIRSWIREEGVEQMELRYSLTESVNEYGKNDKNSSYLWNDSPKFTLLGKRPKRIGQQLTWELVVPFDQRYGHCFSWLTKQEKRFLEKSSRKRRIEGWGITGGTIGLIVLLISMLTFMSMNKNNTIIQNVQQAASLNGIGSLVAYRQADSLCKNAREYHRTKWLGIPELVGLNQKLRYPEIDSLIGKIQVAIKVIPTIQKDIINGENLVNEMEVISSKGEVSHVCRNFQKLVDATKYYSEAKKILLIKRDSLDKNVVNNTLREINQRLKTLEIRVDEAYALCLRASDIPEIRSDYKEISYKLENTRIEIKNNLR